MRTYEQTLAREYEARGMQRGREEGMERGREEVAKNMLLKLHWDLGTVQQATGLTQEALQRITRN